MANLYAIAASLLLLRSACAVKTAFISSSSHNYPPTKHNVNRAAAFESSVIDGASSSGRGIGSSLGQASDSNAEAFMSYMAKSHEDKLRAVKDAEDKKNAEIQALKKQIDDVKSGSSMVLSDGASSGSIGEIAAKLTAYQNFMSEYIVNAQEEKRKAILAAEEAVSKKYEDKLSALMLGAADSRSITVASTSPADRLDQLKLDKKEVKREIKEVKREIKAEVRPPPSTQPNDAPPPPAPPQTSDPAIDPNEHAPPEVIAADHGLRADGGVGGLTLAERVALGPDAPAGPPANGPANGAAAPTAAPTPGPPPVAASASAPAGTTTAVVDPRHRVYFERNVCVDNAARAEAHNRWGPSEEQLAKDYVGLTLAAAAGGVEHGALPPNKLAEMDVTAALLPEVEAADHGLRADGGVDGPSLADRVNLGATLLGKTGE